MNDEVREVRNNLLDLFQKFLTLQEKVFENYDAINILKKSITDSENNKKRKREPTDKEYMEAELLYKMMKDKNTFEEFTKCITKFMIERHLTIV